jgi:paraquat-inducible protein A
MRNAPLIACQACDLLQHETRLRDGAAAHCNRCGTELYREHADSLERSLACALAASVLFVVANTFPIVRLQLQTEQTQSTLYGAVHDLFAQGMWFVAGLVVVTTIVVPAAQIAAISYLLLPLRLGHAPRRFHFAFRLLQSVRPWGMIDVFMLGVLVSLAKLSHMASVVPGIALWSFAGLMFLLAAATTAFDPRAFWIKVETRR